MVKVVWHSQNLKLLNNMGHKVHPKIHRLPVLFPWASRWVSKANYADNVREDIQIREYVVEKGKEAQIDSVHLERSAKQVTITIFSGKPGVLIGRGGQGLDVLRKDIERKLTVHPELFVVGERQGQIVATAMAGFDGHRGWINYLAVSPEVQKQGLGRQLMTHVEQALTAMGCPKLNLQVRAGNAQALAFYQAIGYGQDELVSMGKRLISDQP